MPASAYIPFHDLEGDMKRRRQLKFMKYDRKSDSQLLPIAQQLLMDQPDRTRPATDIQLQHIIRTVAHQSADESEIRLKQIVSSSLSEKFWDISPGSMSCIIGYILTELFS